uniref:Uncharacterized protein n=1 Tax=Anguilla anguilla TaxID=7936 RepID=A0A0E9UX22_ANGAN
MSKRKTINKTLKYQMHYLKKAS